MHAPIAVFDAGIGSYAVVAEIHARLPRQDILYLADRASFPYGGKDRAELLATMRRTIRFLEGFAPSAIVIASNAPSIMVLDELRAETATPLSGVTPPLAEALAASRSGRVGIMGVHSMVNSDLLRRFVARHTAEPEAVALIDASPMVARVEDGSFLFAPEETQAAVSEFVAAIFRDRPAIDVLTLSSTHLPWLRRFFEAARPDCRFLDPAAAIVAGLGAGTPGEGRIRALVTETPAYDAATFRRMLAQIGVELPLEAVRIP